jgi:DNA-binding MarR family transcriptional regulator
MATVQRLDSAIASLCIAAAVPATTALRWIKTMTDAHLFERSSDPDDARRIFIGISEKARLAMDGYFDKLAEGDPRFSC